MRDGVSGTSVTQGSAVEVLCRALLASADHPRVGGLAVSRSLDAQYAGVVFASGRRAEELESLQETLGVGPGPTALRDKQPVFVRDLTTDPRREGWIGFRDAAPQLGVSSVYAFPLEIGVRQVGLLTIHGVRPEALPGDGVSTALRLSDVLAVALLTPELVSELLTAPAADHRWSSLLDGRHAVTHQAVGMVSVQLGGSVDDAMAVLRAHAFATATSLVDVAREVVARRLNFREGGTENPRSHLA